MNLKDFFNSQELILKSQLERAIKNKSKLEEFQTHIRYNRELLHAIEVSLSELNMIEKRVMEQAVKFSEESILTLEQEVEKTLKSMFPSRNFKIKVRTKSIRGKKEAYVEVLMPDGKFKRLSNINGRMFRQTVSNVIILVMCASLGLDFIISDESCSAGDDTSLRTLAKLFDAYANKGNMQVIMVEHKPALYDSIKRREFHLAYKGPEFKGHAFIERRVDIED